MSDEDASVKPNLFWSFRFGDSRLWTTRAYSNPGQIHADAYSPYRSEPSTAAERQLRCLLSSGVYSAKAA